MLGTFPKAFSQMAISQVAFSQVAFSQLWQFPKCAITQAAISTATAVVFGLLAHPRHCAWPRLQPSLPQKA